MQTLVIGDGFIPTSSYVDAFARLGQPGDVDVSTVEWAGTKAYHHERQQLMEVSGANAVDAPPELLERVKDAEALCLHFAPVNAALISAAPRLKVISVARTGLENIDVDEATARGIAVVPALGRNAGAVAELQIGLMLAEARNIARADASVKAGGWRKDFPGARIEIADSVVGMVGFGHVGKVFAGRVGGFGPRLLAYDPYSPDEALTAYGVERAATLEDVFREADFVVVQARHSPETDRFIGAAQLRLMKPGAYFINVSRSRVVDQQALFEVLRDNAISGAGLDVFDEEPLAPDSPWRGLDNLTITTHFGGDTEGTNKESAKLVAQGVLEYAQTGRVDRAVNAEALGWR